VGGTPLQTTSLPSVAAETDVGFIYCPAVKIKMTWSLCAAGRQQQISAHVNETATL